jgi:hypothetical protein
MALALTQQERYKIPPSAIELVNLVPAEGLCYTLRLFMPKEVPLKTVFEF